MDFKGIVDKAKSAIKGNPGIVDKAGDVIDQKTDGKYSGQVDKAQDAVKKASGVDASGGQPSPEQEPKPEG